MNHSTVSIRELPEAAAAVPAELTSSLFQSFFIAGFECATQRLADGRRLDLLTSTGHDRHAAQDFARLRSQGITTIRTGVRWHRIETSPYRYDFAGLVPYLQAVRASGIQAIWDLGHYGYPDDLDIFSGAFVARFAHFARAVAQVIRQETDGVPFFCPINEISFWAWAGGDGGHLNPFASQRSFELKQQLVRASIAAIEAIREVIPAARFAFVDPVVYLRARPDRPDQQATAEGYRLAQYQAWDMLSGRLCPELGGKPEYLDLIGMNFYASNEWYYEGSIITRDDPAYRPFHHLALEVYARYQRPLFIAETGIEGDARPDWLRYMVDEAVILLQAGVPLAGLCLYPILCYPGWADDRHCPGGLWDYANEAGERPIYEPLAAVLRQQQERLRLLHRGDQQRNR